MGLDFYGQQIVSIMYYTKSVLNPFIYGWKNRECRTAFLRLFGSIRLARSATPAPHSNVVTIVQSSPSREPRSPHNGVPLHAEEICMNPVDPVALTGAVSS